MSCEQSSSGIFRLVTDCMWPSFAETEANESPLPLAADTEDAAEPEICTRESVLWSMELEFEGAASDDTDVDSGLPSSPRDAVSAASAASTPSFSDACSSSDCSNWSPHIVVQSQQFSSLGIWPQFNLWSPTSEDDHLFHQLQARLSSSSSRPSTSSSSSSCSTNSCSNLDESPLISNWEADALDWDDFQTWSPMPSETEAVVILDFQKRKEETMHARAAEKRAIKKAKYFARCRQFAARTLA